MDSSAIPLYLSTFALVAAVRLLVLGDPIFPMLPPFTAIRARLSALASSNHGMPLRNRLYVLFRTVQPLCLQWLYTLLFFVDDVVFSGHRSVKIEEPVFIVGGFRTGSTSYVGWLVVVVVVVVVVGSRCCLCSLPRCRLLGTLVCTPTNAL